MMIESPERLSAVGLELGAVRMRLVEVAVALGVYLGNELVTDDLSCVVCVPGHRHRLRVQGATRERARSLAE